MSYDLHIIPPSPDLTLDDVLAAFDRLENGEACPFGEPTEALRACLTDIHQQFPPMSALTEDQIENTIWSVDPDWVDGYIGLCMRWSVTPEQVNRIVTIAQRHGFAVHDPQEDRLLAPPAPDRGWRGRLKRLFGGPGP